MLQYTRNDVHFNLLHELEYTGNDNKTSELNLGAHLTWKPLPYLNLTVTPAWSQGSNDSELWADARSWNAALLRGADYGTTSSGEVDDLIPYISPLPSGGVLDYMKNTRQSYTLKGQLDFRQTWGEAVYHSLTATVGVEIRENKYTGKQGIEWGYERGKNKTFTHDYTSAAERFRSVQDYFPGTELAESYNTLPDDHDLTLIDRVENTFSLYGTIGYTYDSRYTLCINVRNDASNRFGERTNNRFYPVWSAGVRWDIHREKWFPSKSWINETTLRASHGRQGNVVTNVSPQALVSHVPSDPITNENYLQLEQLPNPDLKWEKTISWNLGLDLSLLQNTLDISFDYYKKETEDIVVEKEIPIENGSRKMYINSGAIASEGYELQIKATPVSTRDWTWNIAFTMAYMKDILKKSYTDVRTVVIFHDLLALRRQPERELDLVACHAVFPPISVCNPAVSLETAGLSALPTPTGLFLPSQQPLRGSSKLPAPRAVVIAAGRARPRGFVLLRRLRLFSPPKATRRRSGFCAVALPDTPARRRNVRFWGFWRVRARLCPESRTNRRHGRDGAERAGGHICISCMGTSCSCKSS